MFGLVHNHRLTFDSSRDVGGGVTSFAFRSERTLGRAGQHGILALGLTARKPFSVASAPGEDRVLIGTSVASGSPFKKRLAALAPGDQVGLRGPVNTFTLDGAAERVVMLGQGVGVTPFRSMLAHAAMTGLDVHTTLVHVAAAGHAYREDTEQWASAASYPEHAPEFRTAVLEAAAATPDATFFVAGASAFVSTTVTVLRGNGVANSNIRQDKYLFYKPQSHE